MRPPRRCARRGPGAPRRPWISRPESRSCRSRARCPPAGRARRRRRSSLQPRARLLFSFALPGAAHPVSLPAELQSYAYRSLGPRIVGQGVEGTRVRPDEPRNGYVPPRAGNVHAEIDRIRAQALGSQGPLDADRVSPEGPRENKTDHVELRHLWRAIRVRAPGHVRVVAEIEELDPRPRIHSLP